MNKKITQLFSQSLFGSFIVTIAIFFGFSDAGEAVGDLYDNGSIINTAHATDTAGGAGDGGCEGSGSDCAGCGSGSSGGCGF